MRDRADHGVFPFMKLPPELRNAIYSAILYKPLVARRIYGRLLVAFNRTSVRLQVYPLVKMPRQRPTCIPLLTTCQTVQDEATFYLYHHTFRFISNKGLSIFAVQIGSLAVFLSEVHIYNWKLWGNGTPEALDLGLGLLSVADVHALSFDSITSWSWVGPDTETLGMKRDFDGAEALARFIWQAYQEAANRAEHDTTKQSLQHMADVARSRIGLWQAEGT